MVHLQPTHPGWETCCDAGLFDTDNAMGSTRFQPRRAGYESVFFFHLMIGGGSKAEKYGKTRSLALIYQIDFHKQ